MGCIYYSVLYMLEVACINPTGSALALLMPFKVISGFWPKPKESCDFWPQKSETHSSYRQAGVTSAGLRGPFRGEVASATFILKPPCQLMPEQERGCPTYPARTDLSTSLHPNTRKELGLWASLITPKVTSFWNIMTQRRRYILPAFLVYVKKKLKNCTCMQLHISMHQYLQI